jgi:MFS family permease
MKHLHWRWLLIVGALPAIILTFLSAAFLNESPSWLASRGREEEAREVLSKIMKMNGSGCAKLEFNVPKKAVYADIQKNLDFVFGPAMLYTTLVSCFTCFCKDVIFFGGGYVFPQVLSETVTLGTSPAVALLIGVLMEVPGFILVLVLDKVMDRRPSIAFILAALATCMLAFVHGGSHESGGRFEYLMVLFGFAGYKVLGITLDTVAYQYVGEVYPVSCRVTGFGLAMGVGRIGAVTAPLAYEWTREFSGTWTTFFYILACLVILDATLVAFLPFETRGKVLKESMDDSHETDPLCQPAECT